MRFDSRTIVRSRLDGKVAVIAGGRAASALVRPGCLSSKGLPLSSEDDESEKERTSPRDWGRELASWRRMWQGNPTWGPSSGARVPLAAAFLSQSTPTAPPAPPPPPA